MCHAKKQYAPDYEKALEMAAESNKNTFILFTNSKTCAPCKIFKRDIFTTKKFEAYAKKELILLKVDYALCVGKDKTIPLTEMEKPFKFPKKVAYRGRGPWPYLIVISPDGKQVFSGRAYDKARPDVKSFLKFLKTIEAK